MIVHILIGAHAMTGLLLLVDYARKTDLNLKWWQLLYRFVFNNQKV